MRVWRNRQTRTFKGRVRKSKGSSPFTRTNCRLSSLFFYANFEKSQKSIGKKTMLYDVSKKNRVFDLLPQTLFFLKLRRYFLNESLSDIVELKIYLSFEESLSNV